MKYLMLVVTKAKYNTNISDIEDKIKDHNRDKYITTPEFNTLSAIVFDARIKIANLVTETDFETELKKVSDRVTSNKTEDLLHESEIKTIRKI